MQLSLEPAFLLHSTPYSESSAWLEVFTKTYGKLTLIAKGVKRRSAWRNALQLFQPLLISARGRRKNLLTLTDVETYSSAYQLTAEKLFSGFYVNELLMRLLPTHDAYIDLFDYYQYLLTALQDTTDNIQPSLRLFEKQLLSELGYGLALNPDALRADEYYYYDSELGLCPCGNVDLIPSPVLFSGACLLAIAADDYTDIQTLRAAKRLTRLALKPLLGNKPLKSRELFIT